MFLEDNTLHDKSTLTTEVQEVLSIPLMANSSSPVMSTSTTRCSFHPTWLSESYEAL